ncbi:GNAT family N-acetyltransferase [Paenibacillus allorhizosphaerae]|uniref:dTDP-fucosamine acetyltransferase n=1 Tax=Paenibacillus allorhizosphaerae TaxID=2849866 RepID=A0ABM8VLY3_9BACL|nr:GNAT family N-acetyltransferase [Paenibacillus allorhizosphaerae]CAG7649004.1 dTDP-fucosamine acetyltransferase [Paenibacillus allorhizosphaerae]
MLRKRIQKKDDGIIFELVDKLLLPYARQTMPELRLNLPIIRKRLNDCTTYVDTAAGGQTVGFVSLKPEKDSVFIDMLAVDPKYQGKGVGSRLMRQAERVAALHGCSQIHLWVDDVNGQAQRFYMRHGFEPVQYDPRLRCYLMSKRLR